MKHLGITKGRRQGSSSSTRFLDEYKKLLDDAVSRTNNLDKRYEKYAKAQAWLMIVLFSLYASSGGSTPVVNNVVPFSKPYSQVGIKGDPYIFKGNEIAKRNCIC